MSSVEIFALVEDLKHRRLESRRVFEALQRAKDAKNAEIVQMALDKLYLRMAKQLATVDKQLDKLEELANKVAGMRLQELEDETA
jgi:ABC-type uncharacterized transport system auxiliary subunit